MIHVVGRAPRGPSLALVLALLCLALQAGAGPLLAPGQRLFVLRTEHFDIIYPRSSEASALRLSSMAEEVYAEVTNKLRGSLPARVPVVITPDLGLFNGFANSFPYMHIALYDTPLSLSWTAFRDNFRGLFLHELTHAVSLQIKAPWAAFLSGIFGSWAAPALLNAPEFMIEGSAVSLESDDAIGGRANDPLVKERLRQDIIENRFKSPLEAEGVYDDYPGGTIYYEYGGLFNAYLQKSYGFEAYDRLWRAMGSLILSPSLDPYDAGFFRAFARVYGLPFPRAWADFRLSLTFLGALDPPEILSPVSASSIESLAGSEGRLFWVDGSASRAMELDCATGAISALFDAGSSDSITDAQGSRLLVSQVLDLSDGRNRVESLVYDRAARRFERGSGMADLREGRFFRGGFVGIQSNLHNTDLVYLPGGGGGRRLLLPGSERVMYSSPTVLDARRLALIVAIQGRRSIGILDVDSGHLRLLRPRGEEGVLDYLRQLSASKGILYFNFDSDGGMYKLGLLDGERLLLDTRDYSGGVFMPREEGGRIYYLGRFSRGTSLCRYPGEPAARELGLDYEDFDPAAAQAQEAGEQPGGAGSAQALPYRPLDYANPFRTWILYPDFNTLGRAARVLGYFYLQDPIEANTIGLSAGYDFTNPFAEAALTWSSTELPPRLDLALGDTLVYGATAVLERQSSASLQASLALPVFPSPRMASLGLGLNLLARARAAGGSPYAWPYEAPALSASAVAAWLGRIPGAAKSSSRGLDLTSYHDLDLGSRIYKTEAALTLAWDALPVRLDLWGAWANARILSLDAQSPVFSADRRPPYVEYEGITGPASGPASLLAEGSAALRLADLGLHTNLLGLYLNRFLLDLGYRGAWTESAYLQSSFLRLSLDSAAGIGALGSALRLRLFAEAFARLSVADPNQVLGWRLGFQTSTDAEMAARRGARRGLE